MLLFLFYLLSALVFCLYIVLVLFLNVRPFRNLPFLKRLPKRYDSVFLIIFITIRITYIPVILVIHCIVRGIGYYIASFFKLPTKYRKRTILMHIYLINFTLDCCKEEFPIIHGKRVVFNHQFLSVFLHIEYSAKISPKSS